VLIIAAACVLAFVITLSVLASSSAARARKAAAEAQQSRRARAPAALTAEDLALGTDDFLLPSTEPPVLQPSYAPFRPRSARWSAEQVAKYWVAPRRIATEMVQSMNDQAVQRLFQDVP
jgi:hypothetical protein